ncbi:MAG: membrane dipeptidase, partial [Myxococcaceae bacterium]|nr:membrane dipeptidase [Myxococcaceae bacterium]
MSSGTCVRSPVQQIVEPSIGLVSAPSQQCSQAGYADLHMHLFGDIAHGGGMLAGHPCPRNATTYCSEAFAGPLSPGGCGTSYCNASLDVNAALSACYGTNQDMVTKGGAPLPAPSCPAWLPNCGNKLFHGDHTIFDDAVGAVGTLDGAGDSQMGAPAFSGWPQWTSTTHQQNYYKWLERAWRGGLRLIVQMAVTNTALCITNKHLSGVDCTDSMAFADQQLQAAYDFENFIDLKVGNGVDTNSGWFRIVKTPAEARAILQQGKLAVVLGIEVDNLFNCTFPREQCTFSANDTVVACTFSPETLKCKDPNAPNKTSAQYVRDQVDRYYDVWGVRHMFPIHNFDNSFGGAATWQDVIEVGNRWVEGHWYNSRDCSAEGYSYKLGSEGTSVQSLMSLFGFGQLSTVPYHPEAASCNAFGLFPLGRTLVDQMMRRGMIIDVDHMSSRSFDDTVALAEQFRAGGYPLAASHALFSELHVPQIRHERMRTPSQVAKLKSLGGMVGVMLKDDTLDRGSRGERSTLDYAGTPVVDDCRHSSKTFAQALAFATDKIGASGTGSDFDGVAGHFGPRFGSDSCGGNAGERSTQLRTGTKLGYPFTLAPFGTFEQQQSGTRSFDYNTSGFAHVGLFPDFMKDLETVGLEPKHRDPLFRSADAYIRMWERAENRPITPTCACGADGGETCVIVLPDGGVTSVDGGVVLLPDGGTSGAGGGSGSGSGGGSGTAGSGGTAGGNGSAGSGGTAGGDGAAGNGSAGNGSAGNGSAGSGGTAGNGGEGPAKGCGCSSPGAPVLLMLVGLMRRRRRLTS